MNTQKNVHLNAVLSKKPAYWTTFCMANHFSVFYYCMPHSDIFMHVNRLPIYHPHQSPHGALTTASYCMAKVGIMILIMGGAYHMPPITDFCDPTEQLFPPLQNIICSKQLFTGSSCCYRYNYLQLSS